MSLIQWGRHAAALLLCLALAQAHAAPPPLRDFFRKPQVSQPKVSPSGRYLAVKLVGDDDVGRLAVLDLEKLGPPKAVAGFSNADISRFEWVNDERLVFTLSVVHTGLNGTLYPGLWAVDRDGGNQRELIASGWKGTSVGSQIADRRLEANWHLLGVVGAGSHEVVVERYRWSDEPESLGVGLGRLDTRNGRLNVLSTGAPDHVAQWVLDTAGQPVALATLKQGIYTTYVRNEQGGWRQWQQGQALGGDLDDPYWFGSDGQALVESNIDGFTVLRRLDRQTLKVEDKPLVSFKGFDYRGSLVYDSEAKQLLGLHYETDAPGSFWLNPQLRGWQAKIDALLPGTVNRIICQRCLAAPQLVVTSISDQRPPAYYLFTPASGEIKLLAAAQPWIKPAEMGQRDIVRIPARDGLELPLLLTQPPGAAAGPRPAVLLVHGGPWVRGTHWQWDAEAQFLASRGYVVIEPEFRGSTGYGFKHFKAGWKQWGLAMQDDLVDAVQWAVRKGLVDAKRVCIAGASYGGYATLMGLIKDGDVFQCGISWVGVSDIDLLYSIHWSDSSEESKRYSMPQLVGDRARDAEQLRATSPLLRARELKRPLLLAYGAEDLRVPLKHGTDFKAALDGQQALEWVMYPTEGHGWRKLETNLDFWGRVEKFLDRHIGPGAAR